MKRAAVSEAAAHVAEAGAALAKVVAERRMRLLSLCRRGKEALAGVGVRERESSTQRISSMRGASARALELAS